MSQHTLHVVHPDLQKFVRAYYTAAFNSLFKSMYVATTDACLIFHFDGTLLPNTISCEFRMPKGFSISFDNCQIGLLGMHTQPIYYQINTSCKFIYVLLKPAGIYYLLREKLPHIVNQGCAFDCFSHDFDAIAQQLLSIQKDSDAISIIEAALLNYYANLKQSVLLGDISPVSEYICRQQGMVKIEQLTHKFRVSNRWLEKQFERQVGLAPKAFVRLTRFRSVLQHLSIFPRQTWGQVVETFGYYDQSHLIRDFRDFVEATPSEYVNNPNLISSNLQAAL
jgi:AraC-like DNA-binding protein